MVSSNLGRRFKVQEGHLEKQLGHFGLSCGIWALGGNVYHIGSNEMRVRIKVLRKFEVLGRKCGVRMEQFEG
jgi:hypothetical protein